MSEFFKTLKRKVVSFKRPGSKHGSLVLKESRVSVKQWIVDWIGLGTVWVYPPLLFKCIRKILI